jgi:hypothetical protein
MLTAIGIANFKAYGEPLQRIPLGRVTVLLGPNSGGKSSISQALLVLRQGWLNNDWNCRDRSFMRSFGLEMGGFANYVHRHESQRDVSWLLELDGEKLPAKLRRRLGGARRLSIQISVGMPASHGLVSREPGVTSCVVEVDGAPLLSLKLALPEGSESLAREDADRGLLMLDRFHATNPAILAPEEINELPELAASGLNDEDQEEHRELERIRAAGDEFRRWKDERLAQVEDLFRRFFTITADRSRDFALRAPAEEMRAYDWDLDPVRFQLKEVLWDNLTELIFEISGVINTLLRSTEYLRATRLLMDREGQLSEAAVQAQVESEQALLSSLALDDAALAEVNRFLEGDKTFGSGYQLERYYQVNLRESDLTLPDGELAAKLRAATSTTEAQPRVRPIDRRTRTTVSFHDIGSGVMSVLRQLVFACRPRDSFMMVEEPDASHHPMLQARLADLYLHLAHARSNRFLLETHSPYIVQGLLRRVRQTFHKEEIAPEYQLKPADISIVYVQPEEEGTRMKVIGVSEDGFLLDQIPDGFLYKQAELRFG